MGLKCSLGQKADITGRYKRSIQEREKVEVRDTKQKKLDSSIFAQYIAKKHKALK